MDLLEAKSRIAQALVESIFRRARYEVLPFRADPSRLRFGREDFSPDFRVSRRADGSEHEFLLGIKYRPAAEQFLSMENQRGERSIFQTMRRNWPALYFVLVTERPESGRSCFQALSFQALGAGERLHAVDLIDIQELGLFPHNLEDHEALARRIFGSLNA